MKDELEAKADAERVGSSGPRGSRLFHPPAFILHPFRPGNWQLTTGN
jgi:hypothetical protein